MVSVCNGVALERKIGRTIALLTCGPDGWPTVSLLSVGEVLVINARIRLALWPNSHATANLERTGRGTLMISTDDFWYVRIQAQRGPNLAASGSEFAYFECKSLETLRDHVDYATVATGITFSLHDTSSVLPRWENTIAALRVAPPLESQ